MILSTCNRTEIYTLTDSPGRASNHILRLISDFHGLDANIFDGHSYSLEGLEAMTRSIVNRMLHGPTTTLKDRIGEDFLEAAREMFLRPGDVA